MLGGEVGGHNLIHFARSKLHWKQQYIRYIKQCTSHSLSYPVLIHSLTQALFTIHSLTQALFTIHSLTQALFTLLPSSYSLSYQSLFTLLPSPYLLSYPVLIHYSLSYPVLIHSLTQSLFTLLPSPYSLSYPVVLIHYSLFLPSPYSLSYPGLIHSLTQSLFTIHSLTQSLFTIHSLTQALFTIHSLTQSLFTLSPTYTVFPKFSCVYKMSCMQIGEGIKGGACIVDQQGKLLSTGYATLCCDQGEEFTACLPAFALGTVRLCCVFRWLTSI